MKHFLLISFYCLYKFKKIDFFSNRPKKINEERGRGSRAGDLASVALGHELGPNGVRSRPHPLSSSALSSLPKGSRPCRECTSHSSGQAGSARFTTLLMHVVLIAFKNIFLPCLPPNSVVRLTEFQF
jgi:hypothetical protein